MKQPCKECPFKKTSLPGYLGEASNDPEEFLDSVEHSPNPCHLSVEGNADVEEGTEIRLCTGHLQFLCNTFKMPRDREWMEARNAMGKNPKVFESKQDFINHHT